MSWEPVAEFFDGTKASRASLDQVESAIGRALPTAFRDLHENFGSGEGFVGDEYVILWPVSDLLQFNAEYEVRQYAPNLFLFGSNGGGEAYAFDLERDMSMVMVPFIGMSRETARQLADGFETFLESL